MLPRELVLPRYVVLVERPSAEVVGKRLQVRRTADLVGAWQLELRKPNGSGGQPASSQASKFSPSTPKTPPSPEILQMLRTLLADRFQLQVHRETKEGRGFVLVTVGKGPKLSEAKDHDAFRVVSGGTTGKPQAPDFMKGINASMALFAKRLSEFLRCPVLDQTSLEGDFDFEFEFTANDSQSEIAGPSLSSAIQTQLGLKLAPSKVPVEIIVIDRAQKPTEN